MKSSEENEVIDEFKILALCMVSHIDKCLITTLNLFQLMVVINYYCEIKNGVNKPKLMTSQERKALYGITPEKEKQIEEYLKRVGEEHGR